VSVSGVSGVADADLRQGDDLDVGEHEFAEQVSGALFTAVDAHADEAAVGGGGVGDLFALVQG
jgi:hypothetical protein